MAKGFSVSDILGGQSKPTAPAGLKMQVVMLPAADIVPNPDNAIYTIGDVSMLKADIAERGLRSPLEVLPAQGGSYMLLAGHRRWTACRELTAEGDKRFELLPCVIHASEGADDDLIALITSNATARELTDGERLPRDGGHVRKKPRGPDRRRVYAVAAPIPQLAADAERGF